MPLFRFGQNWDPFADFEREVDRMLHSVNMTLHGMRVGRQYPAINLYERKAEYLLTAELPGTRLEDIELTAESSVLGSMIVRFMCSLLWFLLRNHFK